MTYEITFKHKGEAYSIRNALKGNLKFRVSDGSRGTIDFRVRNSSLIAENEETYIRARGLADKINASYTLGR